MARPPPHRMVNVGDIAPDFEAPSGKGGTVRLSAFRGKERVVLYFFPKAFTPGCDREAREFQKAHAALAARGISVVGVSADPPETQGKYCQELHLDFPVLSDPDGKVARAYGVWKESGTARRVSFGIDRDGRVVHVVDDSKPEPHVEKAKSWN